PLAPSLLLAMPQLRDPNFSRAVVLLCEHGPEGAVGFVVNRPTDIRAANAVALDPPPRRDSGLRLWTGGPVETNRGFLLLGNDPGADGSQRIGDGFYLTRAVEHLPAPARAAPARAAPPPLPPPARVRWLGAAPARPRAGRVGVAHGTCRPRPGLRDPGRRDVGDGDPRTRCRSH